MNNIETLAVPTPTLEGLVAGAIARFKTKIIGPDGTMPYRLIDGVYDEMSSSGALPIDILSIVVAESTLGGEKLREALGSRHNHSTEIDDQSVATKIILAELAKRHPGIVADEKERLFVMTPKI